MTLSVRQLGLADVATFRELRLEALRDYPGSFGSSLEVEAGYPDTRFADRLANATVIGGCADGRIVGTLSLSYDDAPKTRHRAWINGFYVRPAWHGSGLADEMLAEAVACAGSHPDVQQIELFASTANPRAEAFYVRAGFEVQGQCRRALRVGDVYYDERHLVLMLDS